MTDLQATIVVPVFNSPHVVRPCLDSVSRWTDLDRHQVVIVDDGSEQHTAALLAEFSEAHETVEIVTQPRNLGFVSSANRGFASIRTPFGVILNSDTCVTPRWLEKMLRCMQSDSTIAVASPISNFAPHMRISMPPGYDYLETSRLIETLSERRYPDVTTPEGFCFMVRMDALADIGTFDPAFRRGYGEESDLSMRARYAGYRTVCVDDTYIYHRGRGTFGQETRDELYAQNRRIFHDRWGENYKREYGEFTERAPLQALRSRIESMTSSVSALGG